MLEVLFVCEQNDNNISCTAIDFRTGTNLMTYKGGGCAQLHSLSLLRAEYLLLANSAKPLIHVWPINAQEQLNSLRFVAPGCIQAMALSKCCNYLVASAQETIYIWHLATGRMLNTCAKHYQPVTCIRFTDDSSHFVSSSRDGGILVWNLTQVVGRGENSQTPRFVFNDHGLPVTEVHLGIGGMRAYMFTVSLDRTCKIYDLNSGTLLLSVVFSEGLQSVIANTLETSVYVGSVEGSIYEFHIDSLPRTKEYHMEEEISNRFQGHQVGTAVNCLALSCDGQTLISGGQDKQICIWHIPSRQVIKTLAHKGIVSNIYLRTTLLSVFQPEHKQSHAFGGNLRRMIDPIEADENMIISTMMTQKIFDIPYDIPITNTDTIIANNSVGVLATNGVSAACMLDNEKTQKELERLRLEVQMLKKENKEMFDYACKKVLKKNKNEYE